MVAYEAKMGEERFVVVGTKKDKSFDKTRGLVFSPDGRKVAFGAIKGRELWRKVIAVRITFARGAVLEYESIIVRFLYFASPHLPEAEYLY